MSELRMTDTNAADDSGGSVWGLDGNLFIPVVISALLSIGVVLVTMGALEWPWWLSGMAGAIPFTVTLAYVVLFKQGKPPGYDRDLFELWINGRGLVLNPHDQASYRPSHQKEDK